jgi:hypothetical protein
MESNKKPLVPALQQDRSLILSDKGSHLAMEVARVNLLVSFPLTREDIIIWTKDVERIVPEIDRDGLKFLFDCFSTEAIEWDKNKGIQNIFAGLKKITNDNGVWKIKKQWPG